MTKTPATSAQVMAIFAALTYDTISAVCSSPQTAEINARLRAATLMKWVKIGLVQAALFAIIGIALSVQEGEAAWPPALGSGLAGAMLWGQYVHAKHAGLKNPGPPTES